MKKTVAPSPVLRVPPTQEAVLEAAVASFLTRGYNGTSIDLVARDAGVARRTIYNQFKSKEALFEAAVRQVWHDFPVLAITQDAAALSDPAHGLKLVGQAVADFWAPPETIALLRMVIAEGAVFPDLAQRFMAAGKEPAMKALVAYLDACVHRGTLTFDDPVRAAKQFLGLINEPLLWLRVVGADARVPSPTERKRVVQEAVSVFLSAYARPPQ
ncbi:TetR/AcrR family transcriptional regulator [Allopusillimonas soli]|uniref:TetR/AcrR family transcriptional regulator n=1 Tax=Allopusillimonas soli TaxID=659016 RepID=A0A853FCG3_9BURK|nr:TetR/AcrR family transcriptional regulator [Allopusillimonas soli]NYT36560.1 TetR/AcrR family transcriptional regulator [Allopusillimonas soli]TEA75054.1 TetR/AcrR family transcriptional regulator [Allopusillimonas soli]